MAALWGLFLTVVALSYTTTVESASFGTDIDNNVEVKPRLPAYDDAFMRKLCTFLGASYVRSSQDAQCWYTWCHAGEPYHMQCPPGRSVSPHFYWSSEDPCTEADAQEKCLVGFLKNMHLNREEKEVKVDEVGETQHLNDKQTPVEGKKAPVYKEVDLVEEPLEVTPIDNRVEPQEEVYSEESAVEMNDEEPLPEPEPTPELRREEPKMVLKRVEQEQSREDGVYYPGHRRSHVVDSFTPQDSTYGYFPNYNTYYQHYSPPSYFQKVPTAGVQQPQADYLRSADEAPQVYRKPEAKQAPLPQSNPSAVEEEIPQEPMYDAEDLGADYPLPTSNEEQEGYDNEDQPEYEYVDSQQLASIERSSSETASELPPVTMQKEEGEKEEETEEQGDEDIVEAGDDEGEKDPMLYDYFKTHFVEEM